MLLHVPEKLVYSRIVAETIEKDNEEIGIGVQIPRKLKQRVDALCEESGMKVKAFVARALGMYADAVEDRLMMERVEREKKGSAA